MPVGGYGGSVAKATIQAMSDNYGTKAKDLIAGLGPSIAQESYQIGPEVAEQFDPKYSIERDGHLYLDVVSANIDQLQAAGVTNIDDLKIDTFTDKRFFSFRRDKVTGRHFV